MKTATQPAPARAFQSLLPDGHPYQGMHNISPEAGLVYYIAGVPSRGWLAGEIKAALNRPAALETYLRMLVERYETRAQWNAADERELFRSARNALNAAQELSQ
jgi:hypothetical protein